MKSRQHKKSNHRHGQTRASHVAFDAMMAEIARGSTIAKVGVCNGCYLCSEPEIDGIWTFCPNEQVAKLMKAPPGRICLRPLCKGCFKKAWADPSIIERRILQEYDIYDSVLSTQDDHHIPVSDIAQHEIVNRET